MLWVFIVCLVGLIYAPVSTGSTRDQEALRRSWTLCCWFPVFLILPHLMQLDRGLSTRGMITWNAATEIAGWIFVMVLLFSIKSAFAPSSAHEGGTAD